MALPELLSTLTESLTSALDALPSPTSLAVPDDGISLLSTKNELLLSYLQNLVFLITLKLRALAADPSSLTLGVNGNDTAEDPVYDAVVQNLVALGVYLEKGVRPLESRLKYQLDKLLLAAAEESRPTRATSPSHLADSQHSPRDESPPAASDIPPLAHRPNPSSLLPPSRTQPTDPSSTSRTPFYRPPHITPTSLPTTRTPASSTARAQQRARKSAALEEFVREEMGDAPLAEPSIGAGGSGLLMRGKDAERERERRGYEEGRLVRLPEEKGTKKRGREQREDWFGPVGGEWAGLGVGDKGKRMGRKGEEVVVGERWEKRRKRMEGGKRKRR